MLFVHGLHDWADRRNAARQTAVFVAVLRVL